MTARHVNVAVDAAGVRGGTLYTYEVPDALSDLAAGEAVLVPYGHRDVLAVVVADVDAPSDIQTKPVVDRVRSDGPLLPPLQLALARHVAEHYLAPPALVLRAMLPPGHLERLELVARIRDDGAVGIAPLLAAEPLLAAVAAAGRAGVPVRELRAGGTRGAVIRQLRTCQRGGLVDLEWTLLPPETHPRLERHVRLTEDGAVAAGAVSAGEEPPGRRLGPRQRALLLELAGVGDERPDRSIPAQPVATAAGATDALVPAPRLSERHGASALRGLVARGLVSLELVTVERRPHAGRTAPRMAAPIPAADLSAPQRAAVGRIAALIRDRSARPVLLEGETASGKTAVYAEAIAAALSAGRAALVLTPEIGLALPLLDRLAAHVGVDVALLHSGLSDGERADAFARIRADAVRVVVGTRLAVLAPLADPGVVIVDEEHDAAYKSDRTPRYQARDLALELGRLAGAPVVLGSATPEVASVGRARAGEYDRVVLPDRLAGRRPSVDVVDLRAELAAGNQSLLSSALVRGLAELDLTLGDRAILLLNRRGSASVVLCRDCGYVQICPECQRPLVFHAAGVLLRCHHCGASAPVARRCPACGSPRIRYLGGGTERVERDVRARFPALRVGRLDRDVAERKGAAAAVLDAFANGDLDVLVGTSLVAKGLDVPEVTFVGIVSADIALNLPDERAAERTFQLLMQAVGRAGRGDRPGRACIQTYQPEHPAIRAVAEGTQEQFYAAELASRRAFGSPPFGALVKLTVAMEDREAALGTAQSLVAELAERAADTAARTHVLGPAPAYIARRGGRWRFNVILRGADPVGLLGGDPGAPWSIDVDPESLL